MRFFLASALVALVSGCAFFSEALDRPQPVIVTELERTPECGSQEPGSEPKIHYFEAAALVSQWEQSHGVPPTPIDAVVQGPFALIELGGSGTQGQGVLISRNAVLHYGKRLVMQSTFYAAQVGGKSVEGSPCVLLALPPRHYKLIELYDQEGALRAKTDSKEEAPAEVAPAKEEAPAQTEAPAQETPETPKVEAPEAPAKEDAPIKDEEQNK